MKGNISKATGGSNIFPCKMKNKKEHTSMIKILVPCSFFLFTLLSCGEFDTRLSIENNSDVDIWYTSRISASSDTVFFPSSFDFTSEEEMVKSGTNHVVRSLGQWKFAFPKKDDKLHFFVIKHDSIGRIEILKRYDLSLEDLKKINTTTTLVN